MKQLLITIAAVLVVGCGESQQSATPAEAKPVEPFAEVPAQQSAPAPESKPVEPVAEAATPEPPTAKAPDISIYDAAKIGIIEAVKQHLAAGTDVNAKDANGETPLHYAAFKGHKEIAELFIAKGADVNAKNDRGETPLDFYTFGETGDLLRKHGGKTREELKDLEEVKESIHAAARVGHIEAVKQHLAAGTDVNAKDKYSEITPLHCAAEKGHKEIVQLLIANGAEVDVKNDWGQTPLHFAADIVKGHKEITELLIANGANLNAKTDDGATPLDSASGEIADLLRKHGAKTSEELDAAGN